MRRLAEFLAGVRRTKIEAGRFTAGWTRLNAGGRRRRVTVLVVKTRMGSQGRGASLGMAGDSDGWGPDDRAVSSSCPLSIVTDPWTAMAWTVRIRSRQVI